MLTIAEIKNSPWLLTPKIGVNKITLKIGVIYPESPSFGTSWETFDTLEDADKYVKNVAQENASWFVRRMKELLDQQLEATEKGQNFDFIKIQEFCNEYTDKFTKTQYEMVTKS